MIVIKLSIIFACGCLFSWGGFNFKQARRFIMPFLLSVFCCLFLHSLWPLLMLISIGGFSLGYGDNSVFRHIFGSGWGRSVWGLIAAICLSMPLFLTHHLSVWLLIPYLALNFTLENALKNLNQLIGDIIMGMGFASIVFLIHP